MISRCATFGVLAKTTRTRPQQRPQPLEHRPGVAQVLEHLAEDQRVERPRGQGSSSSSTSPTTTSVSRSRATAAGSSKSSTPQ